MIGIRNKIKELPKEVSVSVGRTTAKAYLNYLIMGDFEWMCAYVVVPMKVRDIECHGGVTYSEDDIIGYENTIPGHEDIEIPEGYHVLGWDFNHFDDDMRSVGDAIGSVTRTLSGLITDKIETI